MNVVVLGCGPAGLMAAHAAAVSGSDVRIFSRKRKSEMFGCQYLHAPIPGMTDVAPVEVQYCLHGDAESYRAKVYGDGWTGTVSPEDLLERHDAWDIRRTYDNLWRQYCDRIQDTSITPGWLTRVLALNLPPHDLIINSLPRKVVCQGRGHRFTEEKVWAVGDAPERGIFAPGYAGNNQIICNGLPRPSWYRAARVFGYSTVEWPHGASLQENIGQYNPSIAIKPLDTDCDCWPQIMHVGRYGRWEKGVLSHTAYQQVLDALVTEPVA